MPGDSTPSTYQKSRVFPLKKNPPHLDFSTPALETASLPEPTEPSGSLQAEQNAAGKASRIGAARERVHLTGCRFSSFSAAD